MDKQQIKDIIKEMIENEEIKIEVFTTLSRTEQDSFGNSYGALDDIDIEVYLEVNHE